MINGNRGHGCNCTEQEHADFRLIRTHIRETARIPASLLISTKGARGIVAGIKYILPHRLLLNEGQKFTITYIDV